MEIGDSVKVFLPGESPWTEVIDIVGPTFKGRIDNVLIHDYPADQQRAFLEREFCTADGLPVLHDFHFGDEVWFERRDECWQPVVVH